MIIYRFVDHYLQMVDQTKKWSSTSNSDKQYLLREREDKLRNLENKYKLSKSRLKTIRAKSVEAESKYAYTRDNIANFLKESNTTDSQQFKETDRKISDTKEIIEDYTWDLENNKNKTYNTKDQSELRKLESDEAYFRRQISHYENVLEKLRLQRKTIMDSYLTKNDVLLNMRKSADSIIREYQLELRELLNLCKEVELQRFQVLELISPEKRIQFIETAMTNE
ncbi:hypothetical protein MN116_005532 [Schistosoma mekongi]|uniref:Uncharacterized protein n=1 Tax=Schistosoma mekongi TaxID=38744 RepID=A0AAE1ZBS4_SCHME|nr:hypothetical protein MN116_005532 [Schistosoma mekongi]